MNVRKNMEALVLVAIAVGVSGTALTRTPAAAPAAPALVQEAQVIQVVVSAKRLTPAEKAKLGA